MLTNTDITVYTRRYNHQTALDEWSRIYVEVAWWFKSEKSSITTDGLKQADIYTIRIPGAQVKLQKDDYVVKGKCEICMGTVKDLQGTEYCKVTSVNYNTYGSNPHVKVGGV